MEKREEFWGKIKQYLDQMPVSYCTIKLVLNDSGEPVDFIFTYCNEAHAKLEGFIVDELIGKRFYKLFPNADKKWLNFYYRTAFDGIKHEIIDYSPEIDRHLFIKTYQPEYGYCGCVLQDVTQQVLVQRQLDESQNKIKLLLKHTTDVIFILNLEDRSISFYKDLDKELDKSSMIYHYPTGLLEKGLTNEEGVEILEGVIQTLESGEEEASCTILARLSERDEMAWHQIFFSAYTDTYSGEKHYLGYFKNINQEYIQKEKLIRTAELDWLTGLCNVMTLSHQMTEILQNQRGTQAVNIYYILDLDNFKGINDTKGHLYGDVVLKEFAQVLKESFGSRGLLCRLGGDEFSAFLPDVDNPRMTAAKLAERVLEKLEALKAKGLEIGTSIGILIGGPSLSYEQYYQFADQALYEAKRKGKNTYWIVSEPGMEKAH